MSNQLPKPGSSSLQVAQLISADRKFNADISQFISSINFTESMDFMGSRGEMTLLGSKPDNQINNEYNKSEIDQSSELPVSNIASDLDDEIPF